MINVLFRGFWFAYENLIPSQAVKTNLSVRVYKVIVLPLNKPLFFRVANVFLDLQINSLYYTVLVV